MIQLLNVGLVDKMALEPHQILFFGDPINHIKSASYAIMADAGSLGTYIAVYKVAPLETAHDGSSGCNYLSTHLIGQKEK
jgi:hypothetical protein